MHDEKPGEFLLHNAQMNNLLFNNNPKFYSDIQGLSLVEENLGEDILDNKFVVEEQFGEKLLHENRFLMHQLVTPWPQARLFEDLYSGKEGKTFWVNNWYIDGKPAELVVKKSYHSIEGFNPMSLSMQFGYYFEEHIGTPPTFLHHPILANSGTAVSFFLPHTLTLARLHNLVHLYKNDQAPRMFELNVEELMLEPAQKQTVIDIIEDNYRYSPDARPLSRLEDIAKEAIIRPLYTDVRKALGDGSRWTFGIYSLWPDVASRNMLIAVPDLVKVYDEQARASDKQLGRQLGNYLTAIELVMAVKTTNLERLRQYDIPGL